MKFKIKAKEEIDGYGIDTYTRYYPMIKCLFSNGWKYVLDLKDTIRCNGEILARKISFSNILEAKAFIRRYKKDNTKSII